ncbi:MAG TPA: flagellar motor protein MotB [candidate division Zixibacteria bacterium]|nr:flagellar motor protein MotB [candidate division Zixibacteria bacterium]
MPRHRSKADPKENQERWLLTYADMITLLLAFFIVMYSMSAVDAKKFGKMAEALNGVLRGGDNVVSKFDEPDPSKGHGLLKLGNLRMIQNKIEKRFDKLGRDQELKTEITERGLVVHIMESALFEEGSADLQGRALDILDMVAEEIVDIPNHVRVEGHTDDRDIHTVRFPSNWELSSSRATEVVKFFIENYGIDPWRVSALGYGEYRPIRPNNSIENRAVNRRVDVVILTMELSMKEPTANIYNLASGE